jgi:hypothetical protein
VIARFRAVLCCTRLRMDARKELLLARVCTSRAAGCTNSGRRCSGQVLDMQDACRLVLLENVPGLAEPDATGRSNVDGARDLFRDLGQPARVFAHRWMGSVSARVLVVHLGSAVDEASPEHARVAS